MTYSLDRTRRRAAAALLPLAAAALLHACSGDRGGATKTTGEPSVQAGGGMQGMEGMPGMQGGTASGAGGMAGMAGGMDAELQAHLERVGGMTGEQLRAALPAHRQMVANMLSRMNGEMRQMNMTADASWTATVDSLRQDLVRLPALGAAELRDAVPAHAARVRRLAAMHQSMMRGM